MDQTDVKQARLVFTKNKLPEPFIKNSHCIASFYTSCVSRTEKKPPVADTIHQIMLNDVRSYFFFQPPQHFICELVYFVKHQEHFILRPTELFYMFLIIIPENIAPILGRTCINDIDDGIGRPDRLPSKGENLIAGVVKTGNIKTADTSFKLLIFHCNRNKTNTLLVVFIVILRCELPDIL